MIDQDQQKQLDYLDQIAADFQSGNVGHAQRMFGPLSTGERCYVALAANRPDLLGEDSIAYAINRIGDAWLDELIKRHKGDARKDSTTEELRAENLRLRKIAAHVPAMVYIKAKEEAGYGVEVKVMNNG